MSIRRCVPCRRENVSDVAWVPFFIKSPGQRAGHDSDEPVQLVDVLPTIADILDVHIPWRVGAGRRLWRPAPHCSAGSRRGSIDRRTGAFSG